MRSSVLALVGDRKGIRPQNLRTNYSSYIPSSPLPSLPSLLMSEKDMVGRCYMLFANVEQK